MDFQSPQILSSFSSISSSEPSPVQNSEENLKVALRIRPLISVENAAVGLNAMLCRGNNVTVGQSSFTFDEVFTQHSIQEELFEWCGRPTVNASCSGLNTCIFAYGQTGAGKTYTMGTMGKRSSGHEMSDDDVGLLPRALRYFFEYEFNPGTQVRYLASFIEIHKEKLRDLLDTTTTKHLEVREDKWKGIWITGVHEEELHSVNDALTLLERGVNNRKTGEHFMNKHSSRSHALFTIVVQQKRAATDEIDIESLSRRNPLLPDIVNAPKIDHLELISAKCHFVDLAGSERVGRTGNEGDALKESTFINYGLLALGNVINALADEKKKGNNAGGFVPYRDSKLTRVLQDSLGGNSKTTMIACVSPSALDVDETVNTIRYACRAREIKNVVRVNLDPYSALIRSLKSEVTNLKQQLKTNSADTALQRELEMLRFRCMTLEAERSRALDDEMGNDDDMVIQGKNEELQRLIANSDQLQKMEMMLQERMAEVLRATEEAEEKKEMLKHRIHVMENASGHRSANDMMAIQTNKEKIGRLEEEIKILRRSTKDYERLQKIKEQSEDKIRNLTSEIAALRSNRRSLEEEMKEKDKQMRIQERQHKIEVSALKREADRHEKAALHLQERLYKLKPGVVPSVPPRRSSAPSNNHNNNNNNNNYSNKPSSSSYLLHLQQLQQLQQQQQQLLRHSVDNGRTAVADDYPRLPSRLPSANNNNINNIMAYNNNVHQEGWKTDRQTTNTEKVPMTNGFLSARQQQPSRGLMLLPDTNVGSSIQLSRQYQSHYKSKPPPMPKFQSQARPSLGYPVNQYPSAPNSSSSTPRFYNNNNNNNNQIQIQDDPRLKKEGFSNIAKHSPYVQPSPAAKWLQSSDNGHKIINNYPPLQPMPLPAASSSHSPYFRHPLINQQHQQQQQQQQQAPTAMSSRDDITTNALQSVMRADALISDMDNLSQGINRLLSQMNF